jgi:hypothetical protein
MKRQLEKIAALLEDLGVPAVVSFSEEPHKKRTDLPARVEWALIACTIVTNEPKKGAP